CLGDDGQGCAADSEVRPSGGSHFRLHVTQRRRKAGGAGGAKTFLPSDQERGGTGSPRPSPFCSSYGALAVGGDAEFLSHIPGECRECHIQDILHQATHLFLVILQHFS
ncbi:hypothetical protein E2320_008137, partial [Naja naja]